MTVKMFGIKNCDTIKKARKWLDDHNVDYVFHDYKVLGLDESKLRHWVATYGWEVILNRAGTTFKKIPASERADMNSEKAIAFMMSNTSMIKRPIVETGGNVVVGFIPGHYATLFAKLSN